MAFHWHYHLLLHYGVRTHVCHLLGFCREEEEKLAYFNFYLFFVFLVFNGPISMSELVKMELEGQSLHYDTACLVEANPQKK